MIDLLKKPLQFHKAKKNEIWILEDISNKFFSGDLNIGIFFKVFVSTKVFKVFVEEKQQER